MGLSAFAARDDSEDPIVSNLAARDSVVHDPGTMWDKMTSAPHPCPQEQRNRDGAAHETKLGYTVAAVSLDALVAPLVSRAAWAAPEVANEGIRQAGAASQQCRQHADFAELRRCRFGSKDDRCII